MKKKIYLFLMLLLPMLTINSQTFYVNPNSLNASDSNDGNDPAAPWASLNHGKWVSGCTVMLSAGTHTVLVQANIDVNVTLIGDSKETSVIEGLSQDDIDRGSESPRFFQVNGNNTLTIKDVTIRNFSNSSDIWGGMFNVTPNASLNLQNVDILNATLLATGGAAIASDGTLSCTNVKFENCNSSFGGAIIIGNLGKATFEGVTFLNNSTTAGTGSWKRGGAVKIQTPTMDVKFNKCIFDSNTSSDNTNNTNSQPCGGAISVFITAGGSEKFEITNSLFINNSARELGGGIIVEKAGDFTSNPGHVNFMFANNTFLSNTLVNGDRGSAITFEIWNESNVKGSLSIVNNTFFKNNSFVNPRYISEVNIHNLGVDLSVINNIMLVENVDPATTWDWTNGFCVVTENFTPSYNSFNIKGNIFNSFGGWHSADLNTIFYDPANNNKIARNDEVLLDTELTIPLTGVPYLKINDAASIAIDNGVSSFILSNSNIIPELDIRGSVVYGASKDAGAFEFNPNITNLTKTYDLNSLNAYPNPFVDCIYLNIKVKRVAIFNLTGVKQIEASGISKINTTNLESGLYIVQVENVDGTVQTMKMKK